MSVLWKCAINGYFLLHHEKPAHLLILKIKPSKSELHSLNERQKCFNILSFAFVFFTYIFSKVLNWTKLPDKISFYSVKSLILFVKSLNSS